MSLYEQNKAEHTSSAANAGQSNSRQGGSTTNWRPRTPGGNILGVWCRKLLVLRGVDLRQRWRCLKGCGGVCSDAVRKNSG